MGKFIVGQADVIEQLMIAVLAGGHCLLEGVPGLAKTAIVRSLSQTMNLSFRRIQFTPDLMPSDITGTDIIQEDPATGKRNLVFQRGPIFAQMVLADEINRTPPKTQAALLEAMQERQVTIGAHTYPLENPFLVMATQNPIEQEGTYRLPEAQVDRFMLKVVLNYPKKEEERLIIQMNLLKEFPKAQKVLTPEDIVRARDIVKEVYMDEKIQKYIVDIVFATREPKAAGLAKFEEMITYGASPRASISLAQAAKAFAFIKRRGYVIPEDIRAVCHDVLRHRIGLSYEAEANNLTTEEIISEILNTIEVP